MLSAILQILAVLGILVLVFLGILLVFVLLVLFFPVSYRISGSKDENGITGRVRADWLPGVLRLRGSYPTPGRLTVKLLWITLFDSEADSPEKKNSQKETPPKASRKDTSQKGKSKKVKSEKEPDTNQSMQQAAQTDSKDLKSPQTGPLAESPAVSAAEEGTCTEEPEAGCWISRKIAKIKYTFRRIYDKIKEIWENISYYTELFQEEETRQCLSHVKVRAGKILRSIRPRKIKADIVFGTGSPDTTGYLYGAFCMISPSLGRGVAVTPDFSEACFTGQVDIAGRITVVVLLINGLKLLLDENLKTFIGKMKNGRNQNGR